MIMAYHMDGKEDRAMKEVSFASDYQEGAHEAIIKRLVETNRMQTEGYGTDEFCQSAREKNQASARGGILYCRTDGEHVFLSGKAVLFAVSELMID